MEELLILVDRNDNEIGTLGKTAVHQAGLLHRAFSIFTFNNSGEILLQQRAASKYHSPGLWSNTCCSHPRKDEPTLDASKRRLKEEMGIECDLMFVFSFIYKAVFDNGLIEHEFDHVFFGRGNDQPVPDPKEVMDWKYVSPENLGRDVAGNPEKYTEWLKICLPEVFKQL
jgi:isopentenyl-diphosphate Delta-isomerase